MIEPVPLAASARIMYEAAQQRSIECTLFGDRQTILMKKNGVQWYVRGSRTSLQSSVGKTIADQKNLTKKILTHFSIPTAPFVVIHKESDLPHLASLHFPIVMKPIDGSHGTGVVVNIQSHEEAARAYTATQDTFAHVICEEMLAGVEYRIVCVDFHFLAAAFRKPAHVVGDDTHTIDELIELKNQHPWRGKGHTANLTLIEVDDTVKNNLAEQKFHLLDTPPKDQVVYLRKTANLSTGGEAWDVTDNVCPENRALFEEIAQACDLNTIGIDVMCQSLETPITAQSRAGIIEVNASPGLRMHHFPVQGQSRDVAGAILNMVEHRLHL